MSCQQVHAFRDVHKCVAVGSVDAAHRKRLHIAIQLAVVALYRATLAARNHTTGALRLY